MTQWLTMAALAPLLATASGLGSIAPQAQPRPATLSPPRGSAHSANVRLLKHLPADPPPQSLDISSQELGSPDSTLAVGTLRSTPWTPNERLYGRLPRAESPGVSFRMKF